MFPSLSNDESKLLPVEKTHYDYISAGLIPDEYLQLVLPCAGINFWQHPHGDILSQHIQAGPFSLWVQDILVKNDLVIFPFVPFPLFTFHFMLEGNLHVRMPHSYGLRLEAGTCNLFSLQPGLYHLPAPANTAVMSFHINVQPSLIPEIIRLYPDLRILTSKKHRHFSRTVNPYSYNISPVSLTVIQHILSCRYVGAAANQFLQRCAADLLRMFCTLLLPGRGPMTIVDVLNKDIYDEVFQYLKQHPHRHYNIAELAQIFKISVEVLEKGFLSCFGISVQDCQHMLKMMLVYDRLINQTFTPQEIAGIAGIEVNHMIRQVESYYHFKIPADRN
jgi:AraC-like DNA-binding protein